MERRFHQAWRDPGAIEIPPEVARGTERGFLLRRPPFHPPLTKPRVGRNPNEPGSSFVIPPRATVKFKAGKIMRQRVEKLSRELKEASERKAAQQQESAATVPAS